MLKCCMVGIRDEECLNFSRSSASNSEKLLIQKVDEIVFFFLSDSEREAKRWRVACRHVKVSKAEAARACLSYLRSEGDKVI